MTTFVCSFGSPSQRMRVAISSNQDFGTLPGCCFQNFSQSFWDLVNCTIQVGRYDIKVSSRPLPYARRHIPRREKKAVTQFNIFICNACSWQSSLNAAVQYRRRLSIFKYLEKNQHDLELVLSKNNSTRSAFKHS